MFSEYPPRRQLLWWKQVVEVHHRSKKQEESSFFISLSNTDKLMKKDGRNCYRTYWTGFMTCFRQNKYTVHLSGKSMYFCSPKSTQYGKTEWWKWHTISVKAMLSTCYTEESTTAITTLVEETLQSYKELPNLPTTRSTRLNTEIKYTRGAKTSDWFIQCDLKSETRKLQTLLRIQIPVADSNDT